METTKTVTLTLETCIQCPHHQVVADPDPHDSFNSDDVAVLCKLSPDKPNMETEYASDRYAFKKSAVSCRPYNIRKEALIPDWCPLRRNTVDPCRKFAEEVVAFGCSWKNGVACKNFTRKTKDWCLACRAERALKAKPRGKKNGK